MIRFKLYYDKDKETVWLNQMSSEGWALKSFFAGFYKFEPCGIGEYIYQIDLGDTLYSVSDEYRELMGELGVEIVVLWGSWIILRKRAADGPFELYTDRKAEGRKKRDRGREEGRKYFGADHHINRTFDQQLHNVCRGIRIAVYKLSCPYFRCYYDGCWYRAHGKGRKIKRGNMRG